MLNRGKGTLSEVPTNSDTGDLDPLVGLFVTVFLFEVVEAVFEAISAVDGLAVEPIDQLEHFPIKLVHTLRP